MSVEAHDLIPPINHAPASAAVYQRVRVCIRNLRDLRKFGQELKNPKAVLSMTPVELRKLEQQHFPSPVHTSRFIGMSDEETNQQADSARVWLCGMLDCHDRVMTREFELRMFRLAVEKQKHERQYDWTDMERLYMALTNGNLASPQERLRAAFMIVLHLDYAQHQRDISEAAPKLTERLKRASDMDDQLAETREHIFQRSRSITVDGFACAIPLSLLTFTASNASVVDDNAGCCPICKNSYTSLKESIIEDLFNDYPVRIKYCGHIVGKACLEQWMRTPKIDEAKYPHRTCPLCRVKIEGVPPPKPPLGLIDHLKTDQRAMDTIHVLVYGYNRELQECVSAIGACMSEEIACEELMSAIGQNHAGAKDVQILKDKLKNLSMEKRAWGFRGDGIWAKLREEWMNFGVIRNA